MRGRRERRGDLRPRHDRRFIFRFALLPRGPSYRALNDLDYRFRHRESKCPVWGYTHFNSSYTFLLGDVTHREFAVTLLHEQFHAMSWYYGISAQHRGTWAERIEQEEQLARGFTRMLGYGE